MSTEFLNVTECEKQTERRKSLAVMTNAMANTHGAEMLSLLTVELADRGWDITIITHNRQGFFDFLVDERAHRFSMDYSYHKPAERPQILAQFVEAHPEIDHYLFWEPKMATFAEDFAVITDAGKHTFVLFKDSVHQAITSVAANQKIMACVAQCDAAISSFPLDALINGTTYIPYLYPYRMKDYKQVQPGEKELLLLTSGSCDWTVSAVEHFAALLQTGPDFQDKILHIVPIGKALREKDAELLQELIRQHPENIVLEALCEKPHKILDGYAGVILVDEALEYPAILSVAVAKGVPTLLVKGYADYAIENFKKGFRIGQFDDSCQMQAEIKLFFDFARNQQRSREMRQAVDDATRKEIVDRWENVLLGNQVAEYTFASTEGVLRSAVAYAKQVRNVWMGKQGKSAAYNSSPLVKKAKKKAAAVRKKSLRYPLALVAELFRKACKRLAGVYRRWERNTFLWRSYIDTDMATRKKVQMLILKIYIEFERICKKNGYRFYIAGGTLLGAVRHKGFIPWDDDLDVVMPRKDYDAFLKSCAAELREGFVLNAHAYPYTFTRLEVLGPRTTAPLQRNGRNIFLDILPLDCACEDEKKKEKHGKRSDKLRLAMMDEAKLLFPIKRENAKAVFVRAMRKLFCPYGIMIRKWTRNARKYQSDDAKKWVCLPGDYGYDGESFPVEYWGEPVYMEFEGLSVPAMNKWETYLTEHYGDYMIYPPVSQRSLKHKIYSIDLERYEKMSVEEIAQELSDDYFASTGKRVSFLKGTET